MIHFIIIIILVLDGWFVIRWTLLYVMFELQIAAHFGEYSTIKLFDKLCFIQVFNTKWLILYEVYLVELLLNEPPGKVIWFNSVHDPQQQQMFTFLAGVPNRGVQFFLHRINHLFGQLLKLKLDSICLFNFNKLRPQQLIPFNPHLLSFQTRL